MGRLQEKLLTWGTMLYALGLAAGSLLGWEEIGWICSGFAALVAGASLLRATLAPGEDESGSATRLLYSLVKVFTGFSGFLLVVALALFSILWWGPPGWVAVGAGVLVYGLAFSEFRRGSAPAGEERGSAPPAGAGAPAAMEWKGPGTVVKAGQYTLRDPLTYVLENTGGEPEEDPPSPVSGLDASCIDLRLPVGEPVMEPRGTLGHLPEYRHLTPGQRANYLYWLAGQRTAPLVDIGYGVLYFYGLERRLLLQGRDFEAIVEEAVRLLNRYTFSASFAARLNRFLAYAVAEKGLASLDEGLFRKLFEYSAARPERETLTVALAWLQSRGLPLEAPWAFEVASADPRSPRSVVTERVQDECHALFVRKFGERFPEGLRLEAGEEIEMKYRPASPTLLRLTRDADGEGEFPEPVKIPNVLEAAEQFRPVVDIWTSCIEELRAYSRKIGSGIEAGEREAYETLPDDLKAEVEHPDLRRWEELAAENVRGDGVILVPVREVAGLLGIPERPRLSLAQSRVAAQTAQDVGFAVEPDARFSRRSYGWEDRLCLFRSPDKSPLPATSAFAQAALVLELGVALASADRTATAEDVSHITFFLETHFVLDPVESRRLEALLQVFLHRPTSLSGIADRLGRQLTRVQKEKVAELLVGIAAADGRIDSREVTTLKKAFRALGLEPGVLESIIRAKSAGGDEEGEAVFVWPKDGLPEVVEEVSLDPRTLRRIFSETADAAERLSHLVPAEEEAGEESGLGRPDQVLELAASEVADTPADADSPAGETNRPSPFEGLEERHASLLRDLLVLEEWPRGRFVEKVRSYGLQPRSVFSVVNTWAQRRLGAHLLVEGDPVRVVRRLIREG
jgi:uncharacterized tellurite resistance protein B-like protein